MGTKKECKKCDEDFNPNNYKVAKTAAIGTAAYAGAKAGGVFGVVTGYVPGKGITGAGVGAALAGGATALGAKSVTKCPHCGKGQLY